MCIFVVNTTYIIMIYLRHVSYISNISYISHIKVLRSYELYKLHKLYKLYNIYEFYNEIFYKFKNQLRLVEIIQGFLNYLKDKVFDIFSEKVRFFVKNFEYFFDNV